MRESLKEYCVRIGREELLEQWHPEKNEGLSPGAVSYGSHKRVWWKCENNHVWQAYIYSRVGHATGCPYCAGKQIAPEKTLKAAYPEVAAQWHPTKNGIRGPEDCLPGSHSSAWWRCDRGHEWKATVKSRTEGNGCPVCAGRAVLAGENDLMTAAPLVAAQWHPTKNGGLTPDQVTCGTKRRAWWRCEQGHEWQAQIHARVSGKGCPVCAGKVIVPGENDLQSYAPEIAKQWHWEKNAPVLPRQVFAYSNRKFWWRCEQGHEWQSQVRARVSGNTGCPVCAGRKVLPGFNDLKTVDPLVAAQWHPTKNGALDPTMVTVGSTKRVWWKCIDGHEWKAVIYSRAGVQKCGCPVCAGRSPRFYPQDRVGGST